MSTDQEWAAWGKAHPYYGVITDPQYRGATLSAEVKHKFFESGREHIDEMLRACQLHFGSVSTERTLDFGCGVGRLVLPLAKQSKQAVGIDISDGMLKEARLNAAEMHIDNVMFFKTLADIPADIGRFSFINTFIVLQHIPPKKGYELIRELLARLELGGCAAIHVTYARGKYPKTLGYRPLLARLAQFVRLPLQRLRRRLLGGDPQMLMREYDLNKVLFLVQKIGVKVGGLRFTDHKNAFGVILFLKRE